MRKNIYVTFLLILVFFVSACTQMDLAQISEEEMDMIASRVIVCHEPYIRHETGCCLDTTKSGICDFDEIRLRTLKYELEALQRDGAVVNDDLDYVVDVIEDALQDPDEFVEISYDDLDEVFILNETHINETKSFFLNYIENSDLFKDTKGYDLEIIDLQTDSDLIYSRIRFNSDDEDYGLNFEYFEIDVFGEYMQITNISLDEVYYYLWHNVSDYERNQVLVDCIIENNALYFADDNCCPYQKNVLEDIFSEYTSEFYINCNEDRDICLEHGIFGVPTWIINERQITRALSLRELADEMACTKIERISKDFDMN